MTNGGCATNGGEWDRVDLTAGCDDSPGATESGESETRLTEYTGTGSGAGQETRGGAEMVGFDGREKKQPKKKRPVLTVSLEHYRAFMINSLKWEKGVS